MLKLATVDFDLGTQLHQEVATKHHKESQAQGSTKQWLATVGTSEVNIYSHV